MLNFFKKLFQMIFGGGERSTSEQIGAPPETNEPETTHKQEQEQENDRISEGLELQRISYGTKDTLGKLYLAGKFIAYTIESPKSEALVEGSYPLSLRKSGGKHSTYWFRFKDMHKGMIFLGNDQKGRFSYFGIGNIGKEARGSILLGTEVKNEDQEASAREIWYSSQAYKSVYPKLAAVLEAGEQLELKISS